MFYVPELVYFQIKQNAIIVKCYKFAFFMAAAENYYCPIYLIFHSCFIITLNFLYIKCNANVYIAMM